MSFTVLYVLGIVMAAFAALMVFDLIQLLRGGWTISQAWGKLGRENPIVPFLVGLTVGLVTGLTAGHLWWSIYEARK